jgi:hypothetical protein
MSSATRSRMRSVEVMRLTDAHAGDKGLYVARTKGSNESVKWTPRLAVSSASSLSK